MENEVKICQRMYNGDFGFGSIFEYINIFVLEGNVAKTSTIIEFCSDIDYKKDKIIVNDIVNLSDTSKIRLDEIINEIKINSEYKYNETHYSKDSFSPKVLNYVDVLINEEEYEINVDSNILLELKVILKFNENNTEANKKYNEYLENKKKEIKLRDEENEMIV